jgi:hypothetical protein
VACICSERVGDTSWGSFTSCKSRVIATIFPMLDKCGNGDRMSAGSARSAYDDLAERHNRACNRGSVHTGGTLASAELQE